MTMRYKRMKMLCPFCDIKFERKFLQKDNKPDSWYYCSEFCYTEHKALEERLAPFKLKPFPLETYMPCEEEDLTFMMIYRMHKLGFAYE